MNLPNDPRSPLPPPDLTPAEAAALAAHREDGWDVTWGLHTAIATRTVGHASRVVGANSLPELLIKLDVIAEEEDLPPC